MSVFRQMRGLGGSTSVRMVVERIRFWFEGSTGDAALAVVIAVLAEVDVWAGSSWRGPAAVNAVAAAVLAGGLLWRKVRRVPSSRRTRIS